MATKPKDLNNKNTFGSGSSTPWGGPESTTKPPEGWTPGPTPAILQSFFNQARQSFDLTRKIYPERYVIRNGKRELYYGPGLVDENGVLVRDSQYDPVSDSRQYYGSLDPASRNLLMGDLIKGGFLDKGSLGDYGSEINALQKAFDFANINYSTIGKALKDRIANMPTVRSSGGTNRVYRTTSTQDLKVIASKVAQDVLGRELTDSESSQFARAYQQQEVRFQKAYYGGGTVMEAPSPDVAAQSFAQNVAPQEAAGYGFLNYTNKLFNLIGVR